MNEQESTPQFDKILKKALIEALHNIESLTKEMEYLHNEIADLRERLAKAELENG